MPLLFAVICIFTSIRALAVDGSLKAPNISANTLFLYQNSNFHKGDKDLANPDQNPNGFNLQEVELQFYSDVDPYTKLNILLAVHPEFESTGTKIEEKWVLEPEELYVESISLPFVTLKLGKFKAFVGKQNLLHSHAYPFVQPALTNQALLGDEGLNDAGISAAILLPSSWYSELTLQALRGDGENSQFNSTSASDDVGIVHWKNLLDISGALTLEAGISYATGANSLKGDTTITGADLTFKWRPNEGGRYQSLTWTTEYLSRRQSQELAIDDEVSSGITSLLQYQFVEHWAAFYRYDNLKVEKTFDPASLPDGYVNRNSVNLVYMPSEFSSFKLEYNQRKGGMLGPNAENTENTIFLQANFTIGSHPVHSY